jgi:hypothetical protein
VGEEQNGLHAPARATSNARAMARERGSVATSGALAVATRGALAVVAMASFGDALAT